MACRRSDLGENSPPAPEVAVGVLRFASQASAPLIFRSSKCPGSSVLILPVVEVRAPSVVAFELISFLLVVEFRLQASASRHPRSAPHQGIPPP